MMSVDVHSSLAEFFKLNNPPSIFGTFHYQFQRYNLNFNL